MSQTFSLRMKRNSENIGCSLASAVILTCRRKSVLVEKEIPLEVDAGFLTVTDLNPIDEESYKYVMIPSCHFQADQGMTAPVPTEKTT